MSNSKRILIGLAVATAAVTLAFAWFSSRTGTAQGNNAADPHEGHQKHGEEVGHGDPHDQAAEGGHGHEKEGHKDEKIVRLTKQELAEFGLEVATARAGKLALKITLPGEVVVNADRIAHIVPRVPGIVSKVAKSLGDRVRAGEVLAVLESRELADAKSGYLAAVEKGSLAKTSLIREKKLFGQKISSEQEYLNAKQSSAEAQIVLRSAAQKLRSFGFRDGYLKSLPRRSSRDLTRYAMKAPFAGVVVQKHITLGEKVSGSAVAFTVAALDTVWVNLTVYQKHLASLRTGQSVLIRAAQGSGQATGKIDYISPFVEEATRTATARVVLSNKDGTWRPGIFITSEISLKNVDVRVAAPQTAIQSIDGKAVVFVKTKEGFGPRPVKQGRTDGSLVEIIEGLNPGEEFVAKNGFTLKAELGKGELGEGHSH